MKTITMELTEEEVALIVKHRSKGIKLEDLIENKFKEFPTLEQFMKTVGITMEQMEKMPSSSLNEYLITLDVKTNKLKAYYKSQVKSNQKGIYKISEKYHVSGVKTFVKQKLVRPIDDLMIIEVIDNRVVRMDTEFYCRSIFGLFNIQELLPDLKNNLIQKVRSFNYIQICRLEDRFNSIKKAYENYLLEYNQVKKYLGKEYEALKKEFINSEEENKL